MREIKFKAWDEDNERMLIVGAIDFDGEGGITSINYPQGKVYPNDEFGDHIKLMQYTGLKDKNGVEIYEGDILEDDNGDETFVVRWGEAQFIGENEAMLEVLADLNDEYKVIGNIHENPELLK